MSSGQSIVHPHRIVGIKLLFLKSGCLLLLVPREPHLLVQCQPHPEKQWWKSEWIDLAILGVLLPSLSSVTTGNFPSSKLDSVAISDPFTDLKYMVYRFQYDSTHCKCNSTVKAENWNLVINRKAISIFQEWNRANIKWMMLVPSTLWTLLLSGAHLKDGVTKVIIFAPSAHASMFVICVNHKNYDNSLKIDSNASAPPTA